MFFKVFLFIWSNRSTMHRSECPEKVEPKQRAHSKSTLCRTSGHKLSERQSGHCIKTSRLICIANLWTVFYMMATLVFNELICCTLLRCTCTCKYQELTACYYSKALRYVIFECFQINLGKYKTVGPLLSCDYTVIVFLSLSRFGWFESRFD